MASSQERRIANTEDLIELGAICNTLQRYDCSVPVYRHLLLSRPDDSRVVANLALALTRTDAHSAAVPYYERYLYLGGGAVDTFHGYATSLRALGKMPQAVEWYYRALQVDSDFLDVTQDLVELLIQQNRHVEALSVIGGFVSRLPDYRPHWNGRITAIDAALSHNQSTRTPEKTTLEIAASADHHFIPVKLARAGSYEFFLVDTGASLLTLSPEIVQESRARPRFAGHIVTLKTVSGTIVGEGVLLPEIQIGSLWLQDVEGVVCDGCPALLGQSVLRRFDLRTTRRHSVEFLLLTPRQ
jgi:predicted aspartyl protease